LLVCASAAAFACFTPRPPLATPRPPPREPARQQLTVTATAYNSTVAQTDATSTLAAWGSELHPGMRLIAVSRDLEARGLGPGTLVRIEGLPGEWEVADRMPSHRRLAIDVYMGLDVAAAREFGKRRVAARGAQRAGVADDRSALKNLSRGTRSVAARGGRVASAPSRGDRPCLTPTASITSRSAPRT
jgi:3D (Asp-Asp-Asp) domain-containing protein